MWLRPGVSMCVFLPVVVSRVLVFFVRFWLCVGMRVCVPLCVCVSVSVGVCSCGRVSLYICVRICFPRVYACLDCFICLCICVF